VAPALAVDPGVDASVVTLAHDPQTSGGLLAAVPAETTKEVVRDLHAAGIDAWQVGRVEATPDAGVELA
jgi:selenide,water dikinase